jgi:hypothetical protein
MLDGHGRLPHAVFQRDVLMSRVLGMGPQKDWAPSLDSPPHKLSWQLAHMQGYLSGLLKAGARVPSAIGL